MTEFVSCEMESDAVMNEVSLRGDWPASHAVSVGL